MEQIETEIKGVAEEVEIWSWGAGTDGQLATGRLEDEYSPRFLRLSSLPPSFGTICSLSCGGAHVIALTSGGKVLSWGRGSSGQLGHGNVGIGNSSNPKLIEGLNSLVISNVSAGWNHSSFVSDSGLLLTCGDGSFGQLGHGDYRSYDVPTEVSYFSSQHVVQTACGMRHSLVLSQGNKIYGFGLGKRGQLGVSKDKINSQGVPKLCLGIEDIKISSIYANGDHSAALSDYGHLYTWGRGFAGLSDFSFPIHFSSSLSFKQAALGWNHALLLTCEGELFMLGVDLNGRTMSNPQKTVATSQSSCGKSNDMEMSAVPGLNEIRIIQITAGAEHSAIVTEDGEIRTWGWGEHGQLGLGNSLDQSHPHVVNLGSEASRNTNVYCGSGYTFVLRRNLCSSVS